MTGDSAVSVARLFDQVVATVPERIAVIDQQDEITYAELDRRSGALGATLARHGVEPGSHVGVLVARSIDLAVAIIAVLRMGAVLVPVDPEQPGRRRERQFRQLHLRAVITDHGRPDGADAVAVGERSIPVIAMDAVRSDLAGPAWVEVDPEAIAYVIFTSGSTGAPKGVEVSHQALLALMAGMEQAGYFSPPGARVAWNASVAFDASVQGWCRLLRGDTVGILSDDMRRDPFEFADFVRTHRLTDIDMTPSHARMLLAELTEVARESHPLHFIVAGEAMLPELWRAFQQLRAEGVATAANLYGPTETTVNVLGTMIEPGDSISIGRPLPGVDLRVVDEALSPVADGEAGELCVVGPYLARGYLGQVGLTAIKFAPDPLTRSGGRMYRTGDLVRRADDGNYLFIGRADDQVKIHGHRVELGEVESVIADHPQVTRAVVFHGLEGADQLSAVVCVEPDADTTEIAAFVAHELPAWMRPASYCVVDAVPLTTSGKTDRALLRQSLLSPADRERTRS